MKISKDAVVSFSYKLSEDGVAIEDTRLSENVLYLHGHGNMLDGIEQAMEGKATGDSVNLTLPPEKAYGMRRQNSIVRIPIKHLDVKKPPKAGEVVSINTRQGLRQALVIKSGRFNVDVDTNHPLAGKTLTFDIEVGEVRTATEDELSHGHAHGAGGHQH